MTETTSPTSWPAGIARKRRLGAGEPPVTAYLLIDGFSMMAFVAATEPLRIANRIAGETLFRWQLVSESGSAVTASNGMRVLADVALGDIAGGSRLAICSGFLDGRSPSRAVVSRLRALDGAGAVLGGIDTGCFALAEAGLLDGQTVTLHWESLPTFRERYPLVHAVESLYEIGARRFSCAGGMAATDMALAELAREHGPDLARAVAEQLIHDRARDPASRQRLSIGKRLGIHNAALVRVIALMESHLDEPLAQTELARRIGLSNRQLQRLFGDHLGSTPAAWYRRLRLERARQLLRETEMSVTAIGIASGFRSASVFARSYRRYFGCAPGSDRR